MVVDAILARDCLTPRSADAFDMSVAVDLMLGYPDVGDGIDVEVVEIVEVANIE